MNMENLSKLREDLVEKAKADAELNAKNFNSEKDQTLTEEEAAAIEAMKAEMGDTPTVMVTDSDADGRAVQVPASEYAKSLDDKVAIIGAGNDMIKAINSGDITKSVESIREDTRNRAVHMFRSMAVNQTALDELDNDSYLKINDAAVEALQKYFSEDQLKADIIVKKLSKLPMQQIMKILPKEFLEIYLTESEIKSANVRAKDRLLSVVAYLLTAGPELDYLNDYIDEENKLMVVSKRLMQCQIDFAEMLKDDATMSDLIARSRAYAPIDTSFWSKYIQIPNRVHNEFAQRIVIYDRYEEAYQKVLEDYPESPENEKARQIILNEIHECQMKHEVYQKICDLTLMRELWDILVARLKINKKTTMQSLTYEATEAVDKVRRCKQNLPFPGYKGDERKPDQILANYIVAFDKMLMSYNDNISAIKEKNEDGFDECGVELIQIDGYETTEVMTVYATLLVILMGRILKRCTRNTSDKYDAITLDAYFQLFCKIGTDVYVMRDIWDMCKDFVKYVLDNYYIPGKESDGKKRK